MLFQNLRSAGWIDEATRMVALELILYNPSTDIFLTMRLMSEFLPTGGITPQSEIRTMTLRTMDESWLSYHTWYFLLFVVVMCMVLGYVYVEVQEMYEKGFFDRDVVEVVKTSTRGEERRMRRVSGYLSDPWNIMECLNLIIFVFQGGYEIFLQITILQHQWSCELSINQERGRCETRVDEDARGQSTRGSLP